MTEQERPDPAGKAETRPPQKAPQKSTSLDEAWTNPYTGETFLPRSIVEELRRQFGKGTS